MRLLLHTIDYLPSFNAGANRMKVFSKVFAREGNEVKVITASTNKKFGDAYDKYAKVTYVPTASLGKKTTFRRLLNNFSFAFNSVIASFFLGKVDVVITTSPPVLANIAGWMIAKIKRATLIYDIRDIWPDVAYEMGSFDKKSIYGRVFDSIANFMYRKADIISTVSPGKVKKLQNKLENLGIDNKVMLVSNGFDKDILKISLDQEAAKKYGMDTRQSCVYIGNVGLAQGLGTMLDLARDTSHKDMQFLIFGEGLDKKRLEDRAREEQINNVKFCGNIPQNKVPSILKSAKIAFIALKNDNMLDSIPTKLYEALGLGCPVLLLAKGDASDLLLETGLGECVAPGESYEAVKIFDKMIDNYDVYEKRKSGAMKLIQCRYSREKATLEFCDYLSALSDKNN